MRNTWRSRHPDCGRATTGVHKDFPGPIQVDFSLWTPGQVYPNGLIATIAGNGSRGYSGDGGLATRAQLNAPSAMALGSNGNLYVADVANNAVRRLQYAGNGLAIGAVTSAASRVSGSVAPGEVVALYGSGPAARLTPYQLDPTSGLVSTNLAGTSVMFNGTPAPPLHTSATQIAAVTPYSMAGSNVRVFVQYQGQTSAPVTLPVAGVAPALFTVDIRSRQVCSGVEGRRKGVTEPLSPRNPQIVANRIMVCNCGGRPIGTCVESID